MDIYSLTSTLQTGIATLLTEAAGVRTTLDSRCYGSNHDREKFELHGATPWSSRELGGHDEVLAECSTVLERRVCSSGVPQEHPPKWVWLARAWTRSFA